MTDHALAGSTETLLGIIAYESDQVRVAAQRSQHGEHADLYALIERLAAQVTELTRLVANGSSGGDAVDG